MNGVENLIRLALGILYLSSFRRRRRCRRRPSSIIMPRRDVRTHYGRTKWQFRQIKRRAETGGRLRKDAIKNKMDCDETAIIGRLRKRDVLGVYKRL